MTTTISSSTAPGASSSTPAASSATSGAVSEDRFLKLLVAQLSNQDPMNPMDNAQMTSQMAQISTVSSVQQVNQTLQGLATQLASMQMLQGSSLVGHQVLVEGNALALDDGKAAGAIDLALKADSVRIDILSAGGQLVDSFNLGPQEPGRHNFEWDATGHAALGNPSYRVTATAGGQVVGATPLVRDRVLSVGAENGAMNVQLQRLGTVAYGAVKSIL